MKPTFIMMVGLPGSGKSTLAVKLAKEYDAIIVSSDEIRRELYGDAECQDNPEMIFREMHKRSKEALLDGKSVVYDATNINRKHRKHTLDALPKCAKIAQIVWAKYATCVAQDAQRERKVGEAVIKRMIKQFQVPYYDEGFSEIRICVNGDKYDREDYRNWMDCPHDNPHHPNTVKEHTDNVCELIQKYIPDKYTVQDDNIQGAMGFILYLAAALHDAGKKFTKSFINSKGEKTEIAHYYQHHNVSGYYALGYRPLDDIGMSMMEKMLVVWLVNNHMDPFFNTKYYRSINQGHRELLDMLHDCDVKGA